MFWLTEQLGGVLVVIFGIWLAWQIVCWLVDLIPYTPPDKYLPPSKR